MTVLKALLICYTVSFAVHYGWKMRGTVIGGEKGAMLPGLLCGMLIALFAGGSVKEYFYIPAAAGLIGMSYGGIEPYGDTISFVLYPGRSKSEKRRGYIGLAVKGALWFSVGGGFIGLTLSAMGGRYSVRNIIVFCMLIPVVQSVGYGIFNQPYKKDNSVAPRIWFSYESREEWGSNAGIFFLIIIYALVFRDVPALSMCLCGFGAGAAGWIIAIRLYYYTEHPLKNGRYLLGIFSEKKLVGGWGNMEYCLGGAGGFGIALGFVLANHSIAEINSSIAQNGIFSPLSEYENFSVLAVSVCFVILVLINLWEYDLDKKSIDYDSFHADLIERPFFNTLPFVLIFLCSVSAAKLMTLFMLVLVLCIKNTFDRFGKDQPRSTVIIVSVLLCTAVFVYTAACGNIKPWMVSLAGGLPYIAAEAFWHYTNKKRGGKEKFKSLNNLTFTLLLLTLQASAVLAVSIVLWRLI